ncbi:serine hydrolase domain-containing protein [Actinophytocola sp. KF-1]
MLGLLGAVPVAAGTAFAAGPSATAVGARTPEGLRPGGELDRFVADKAARDEFSGSLLLTHRGRTVLARSHGMADKARGVPNGPDTAFALASVTKLTTAVAIALLVREGKVSHGARLGAYLDGFPDAFAGITVHHLLTHTSGLGDYHGMPGYQEEAATWTSPAQVMAGITGFIRRSAPMFAPGAGFSYSNSAYHLLGEIVAKVSGVSYHDYVREHVFAAAGMTGADFVTKPEWRTGRRYAHPYHRDAQGRWVDALEEFEYIGTPAGEAFATCADLARFARHLYGSRFLGAAQTQLVLSGKVPMPQPQGTPPPGARPRANYQCYGPVGTNDDGRWIFGHGGGNPAGIATSVDFFPATDWVVVVLGNHADAAVLPIVAMARDLIARG